MSDHVTLYRKYRPQNFESVVGQEDAVKLLKEVITTKKVAHAYLFCGGRGVGKTSLARIFAKSLGVSNEDIIELDAASNRGIDDARELREAVRTAPFNSTHKIYILDEAHMLTTQASNALLKTLEEPPAHIIFILATTDPEKLPATIVSRCQKIIFKTPSLDTLTKQVMHVAKQEGYTVSEEVAKIIAEHGRGSFRDTLGVLEQTLATAQSKTLDKVKVLQNLGVPETATVIKLLSALLTKDSAKVIASIEQARKDGTQPINLYHKLVELTRHGLILRINQSSLVSLDESTLKGLQDMLTEVKVPVTSGLLLSLLTGYAVLDTPASSHWIPLEAVLLGIVE